MKRGVPLFVILFVILLGFIFIRGNGTRVIEKSFLYFDTFINIKIYSENNKDLDVVFKKIKKELGRIDSLYGYGKGSLAYKLSKNWRGMKITQEEYYILKESLDISRITNGSFDITVGALKNIWGFKDEKHYLPDEKTIKEMLSKVGYRNIYLSDTSVSLTKKGIALDFGGISKGYAVDRIVEILKKEGIKAGIVNAGGDLKIFGEKPNGGKWIIGITNPEKKGVIIKKIKCDDAAIATSGSYERYFIVNGKKYNHILNPFTGYPANKCESVTVITSDAITADALATGIFVLGPEAGMSLVKKLPQVKAIIMYKENGRLKIVKSEGIDIED